MNKISSFAVLLIGFCFSFLMLNPIAFGISLSTGILILTFIHNNKVFKQSIEIIKKTKRLDLLIFFLFLISFSLASYNSIQISRSIPVIIYLILFILFAFVIHLIFSGNKKSLELIFKYFTLSLLANSLIIFFYNITNYELGFDLIKFKGYMSLISLLTIINFFFFKSKLNLISIAVLIPNIFMTGSSSSILGLICGFTFCLSYLVFKKYLKFKNKKIMLTIIILVIVLPSILFFSEKLPGKFDDESIKNFEYIIPIQLIDPHRQFIWGFSINKFKDKPLFGHGPDSSNFIEGSQIDIGSEHTGDMNFIPSHPHNFLIELLLETGIIGTFLFIILLLNINSKIWNLNSNTKFRLFLIFFNSYFWCSSLVNFSFWLGWWQGSYYLLLSLIASKGFIERKIN